jgi:hypothetical protein
VRWFAGSCRTLAVVCDFRYRRLTMLRPNSVRFGAILTAFFVLALPCGACAQAFSADAVGTGTLVAWLSGLEFHATIAGGIQLAGEVALDGEAVSFNAEGTLCGFGVRGITTLISEGWVGYTAAGQTVDREPIEIRGLLYVKRKSLVPLQAGDLFVGAQRAVIDFGGEAFPFLGAFSGTAEGSLEPAETPMTIQLGGTGTVRLEGEEASPDAQLPSAIPLDHPALPLEFLRYVAGLDLGI